MSDFNTPYGHYGIDPRVVEAAMRKARRERSQAMWNMLAGIFDRKDAYGETETARREAASPKVSNEAPCAAC